MISSHNMQAPKVPFVSLAGPFTPSGNTILVTGGASGVKQLIAHAITRRNARRLRCVKVDTSSGIGLAIAAKLLELGNIVSLTSRFLALIQHKVCRSSSAVAVRTLLPKLR